jgi:hypothetical protein
MQERNDEKIHLYQIKQTTFGRQQRLGPSEASPQKFRGVLIARRNPVNLSDFKPT